jgi:hypothetical protein
MQTEILLKKKKSHRYLYNTVSINPIGNYTDSEILLKIGNYVIINCIEQNLQKSLFKLKRLHYHKIH